MGYARKITPSLWHDGARGTPVGLISGDVVGDVRPSRNRLSVWLCAETLEDIDSAALAIGSQFEVPEGFHIAVVTDQELDVLGCVRHETKGDTPVDSLKALHRDIGDLDTQKLWQLIELLSSNVRSDRRVVPITKDKLMKILSDAIDGGLLLESNIRGKETKKKCVAWREKRASKGK